MQCFCKTIQGCPWTHHEGKQSGGTAPVFLTMTLDGWKSQPHALVALPPAKDLYSTHILLLLLLLLLSILKMCTLTDINCTDLIIIKVSKNSSCTRIHAYIIIKTANHLISITNLMHLFIKSYHHSHLKLHMLKMSVMHN
jgi:hypothetical protein